MKEVAECLKEWLKFYSSCQELAQDGLIEKTGELIGKLKASIDRKSAALKGKAGRPQTPLKDRRRIAKQKGSLRVVAAANGISPTSVALWRKELGNNQ